MGRTASYVKSQQHGTRVQHNERKERSHAARAKRRGEDDAARTIQKVVVHRPLPKGPDQQLLLAQFAQSCRLPAPSFELCHLMRDYAGLTRGAPTPSRPAEEEAEAAAATTKGAPRHKRAREEPAEADVKKNLAALEAIADALIATETTPLNDDEEDEAAAVAGLEADAVDTVLLDILQSDCGRRVVATLLAALSAMQSRKCDAVAKVVLAQFEENEQLAAHHVACRVMSALVQYGTPAVQTGVLNLFRERATSAEAIKALLTDRHTAGTIENLLKHSPTATVAWLTEVLSLNAAPQKKASKKAAAHDADVTTEDLLRLIEDPVAGQAMRLLVSTDRHARAALLARFDVTVLLASKRGTTLLAELLTFPSTAEDVAPAAETDKKGKKPAPKTASVAAMEPEAATALVKGMVAQLGPKLAEMAVDKKANFVVQRVVQIIPLASPESAHSLLLSVVTALGGDAALKELAVSPVGVHVVVALGQTAAVLPGKKGAHALEEVGAMLITSSNVAEFLVHQHASLVVRQLMPLVSAPSSKVGQLLKSTVEQEGSGLAFDHIGNLVMQEYMRALGTAGASAFGRKLSKDPEQLLTMCRHPAAAHVIYAMLGLVDPQTHTALCDVLKRQVVPLATHLNGRFIIEKLLVSNRDIRDELVRRFTDLAQEKGTQHVLCALVANLDARGKQNITDNLIVPHLMSMATHACASIVLQKLMQVDAQVLEAVQQRLRADVALRNALLQNFFGKFVVQISQNAPPKSS